MRQRILVLASVACGGVVAACSQDYPTLSSSAAKEQYTAQLTAARAGVTTQATGTARFTFQDSNTIRYEVVGTRLTGFNRLQVQAGTAADSGAVMATLFQSATPANVDSNRVVRQGDILRTAAVFTAPFNFDSLARRIRAGTAFVIVRTSANPAGELRGQLVRAGG